MPQDFPQTPGVGGEHQGTARNRLDSDVSEPLVKRWNDNKIDLSVERQEGGMGGRWIPAGTCLAYHKQRKERRQAAGEPDLSLLAEAVEAKVAEGAETKAASKEKAPEETAQ